MCKLSTDYFQNVANWCKCGQTSLYSAIGYVTNQWYTLLNTSESDEWLYIHSHENITFKNNYILKRKYRLHLETFSLCYSHISQVLFVKFKNYDKLLSGANNFPLYFHINQTFCLRQNSTILNLNGSNVVLRYSYIVIQ